MIRTLDLHILIVGQAGQGVQLAGEFLARSLVRGGYHVLATQSVMSRIRGGHNFCRLRVSDQPVLADGAPVSLVVALDAQLARLHYADADERAVVLADDSVELPREEKLQLVQVPLRRLAIGNGGELMMNSVAVGAALALLDHEFDTLAGVVEDELSPRGGGLVGRNIESAQAGFELMRARARHGTVGRLPSRAGEPGRLLITGAEALALGAVVGGAGLAAGYPMSPATPVLESLAAWSADTGMIVEQVEDEIAAVNLAIGSSFAGRLGLVATAGGGLALMSEALSLAGMTETPVVLLVGMRPGPATGLATRTAQADLLFAVHAGHGEFPRVVLAPGDAAEAIDSVVRAARLAWEFQTPTIVLFDQFLADASWTISPPELGVPVRLDPGVGSGPRGGVPYGYRRYEITGTGVSPRLLPGTRNQLVYADSDEHTDEGHITESASVREGMVDKRNRKLGGIASATKPPAIDRQPDAEGVVVTFGTTNGVVAEAIDRLRTSGRSLTAIAICDVWPFPRSAVLEAVGRTQRVVTVEGNYTGQLAQLLGQECQLRVAGTVRRFDGRPFGVDEVEDGIRRILEGAE